MNRRLLYRTLWAVGLIAIAVAAAADWLGLGSDPGFGPRQYLLMSTGLLAMLMGAIVRFSHSRRTQVDLRWKYLSLLLTGTGLFYAPVVALYPENIARLIIEYGGTPDVTGAIEGEPSEPLLEELVRFFEAHAENKWLDNQARFDLDLPTTKQAAMRLLETIRAGYRDSYLSETADRERRITNVTKELVDNGNGSRRYRVRFQNDLGLTISGILSVPLAPGPHPVILIPNGMTSTPERLFLIDDEDYHHGVACRFEGDYVVFGLHIPSYPDYPYETKMHNRMNWAAQVAGMNYWYYLMVDKVISALDYLHTRSKVDPDRTAIYGISMGGVTAILASAGDERIKVVAASGTNVFTSHYKNMLEIQPYERPSLFRYDRLSAPTIGATALAVFPRRLIIELNRRDWVGDFDSALRRARRIKRIYSLLGHGEDAVIVTIDQDTSHLVGHEMGIDSVKQHIDAWFRIKTHRTAECPANNRVAGGQ